MARNVNRIPSYKRALQKNIADSLRSLGDKSLRQIDKGFERGEAPTGESWAPLAPATVAKKGHGRILIDTGELRDSFGATYRSRRGRHQLTVFSDDEKLKFHEFGTETMPKRPVMEPLERWWGGDVLFDQLEDAFIGAERDSGVRGRSL